MGSKSEVFMKFLINIYEDLELNKILMICLI